MKVVWRWKWTPLGYPLQGLWIVPFTEAKLSKLTYIFGSSLNTMYEGETCNGLSFAKINRFTTNSLCYLDRHWPTSRIFQPQPKKLPAISGILWLLWCLGGSGTRRFQPPKRTPVESGCGPTAPWSEENAILSWVRSAHSNEMYDVWCLNIHCINV